MVDVLTHVIVAYVLATALSLRYAWLTRPFVTIAMIGAMIPDVTKIYLALSNAQMEAWLGVSFSWNVIHTLGGSFVGVAIGSLLVSPTYRKRVFVALLLGMLSHHALDVLIVNPTGFGYDLLWPLSNYRVPTAGLYHSSDRWPAIVAGAIAAGVYLWKRRVHESADRGSVGAEHRLDD